MKKFFSASLPILMIFLLFSAGMAAQQTTVSVKVKKDGKVVKDTTYNFEDENGNIVKTREVKVIVSGGEDGEWTVTEEKTVKKKSKEQ